MNIAHTRCMAYALSVALWLLGCVGGIEFAFGATGAIEARPTASGQDIVRHQDGGHPVWRVRVRGSEPLVAESGPDGATRLSNGYLLDEQGDVVARRDLLAPPAVDARADPGEYYWSEWVYLTDVTSGSGPRFDSAGNAWVLLPAEYRLAVSTGPDGIWSFLTVPDELPPGEPWAITDFVIDNTGTVTVFYQRTELGPLRQIAAARYSPSTGWQPPELIDSTSAFYQSTEAVTDARNNVLFVYGLDGGDEQLWYLLYDADTQAWLPRQPVPGTRQEPWHLTLRRSPSGDHVYLMYLFLKQHSDIPAYVRSWDGATRSWSVQSLLPGSSQGYWDILTPGGYLPASVDGSGNLTVVWAVDLPPLGKSVIGSRFFGGRWQRSRLLLPWSRTRVVDPLHLTGADASATGNFMAVCFAIEDAQHKLFAFHFDRARGWLPTATPYSYVEGGRTFTKIRWLYGRQAVVTVSDYELNSYLSVFYDGTGWLDEHAIIDPDHVSTDYGIDAGHGQVLSQFERIYDPRGVVVTWLRPEGGLLP